MIENERQIRDSDAAFETIYIISKKVQAETLYFVFSFIRQPKNLKPFSHVQKLESIYLIYRHVKNLFHLMTLSL
jgi:hypothetical protein